MNYVQEGVFVEALEAKVVSEKFTTQLFKIKIEDRLNDTMVFQANNDRRDILLSLNKGDKVEVTFNIHQREGRENTWFTNLEAWKIRKFSYTVVAPKLAEVQKSGLPAEVQTVSENKDDLPF